MKGFRVLYNSHDRYILVCHSSSIVRLTGAVTKFKGVDKSIQPCITFHFISHMVISVWLKSRWGYCIIINVKRIIFCQVLKYESSFYQMSWRLCFKEILELNEWLNTVELWKRKVIYFVFMFLTCRYDELYNLHIWMDGIFLVRWKWYKYHPATLLNFDVTLELLSSNEVITIIQHFLVNTFILLNLHDDSKTLFTPKD